MLNPIAIKPVFLVSLKTIVRIPKKINERRLEDFIFLQTKKFRRNQKHKYIQLQSEVVYSKDYVYFTFLFPVKLLELEFALSIVFKCQRRNIPCAISLSKPIAIERLDREIIECAEQWAERKLSRKCYKLNKLREREL